MDEWVLFRDSEEIVDMYDLSDSFELRRMASDWVDGLLSGRAGDSCVCSVSRLGKGGAEPRVGGEGSPFPLSELFLEGRAGGGFLVGRAGRVGVLFCEVPFIVGEAVGVGWD